MRKLNKLVIIIERELIYVENCPDTSCKEIAIFGCGDENMSDSFCNAVGIIYRRLLQTGAKFIGDFSTSGYSFEESKAKESSGMAVGLLIDETNHPELTRRKISEWCDELNNRIK